MNTKLARQIEDMKLKLAEMEEELNKPEKFEFKYEKSNTFFIDFSYVGTEHTGKHEDSLANFRYRITQANAQANFLLNKQVNFIGALFEQIDENYSEGIDWKDESQKKHYMFYDHLNDEWEKQYIYSFENAGIIYTTKESVVEEAINLLDSGQVIYPVA